MKFLSLRFRPITAVAAVFAFTTFVFAQDVHVSGVDELYAAINDPQNAGRQVVAAPGVYMLSTTDSNGTPRPNGGRLEFQENMSLVGVVGDRTAVVINGINLPAPVLPNTPIPFGAIRLGRGRNAVEWLTVRDTRGGQGNIVTSLAYSGPQYVRVAHVASTGAPTNLSIFSFGAAPVLEVDLVDNELFGAVGGLRLGLRIRNSSGATGGVINARLIGNRVWGNQFNIVINTAATGATTNVTSVGNDYFDNGNGLTLVGGLNSSGNTLNFQGFGDSYTNNNAGSLFERGGLVMVAGDKGAPVAGTTPIPANDNTVNATIVASRVSGNEQWDLAAIGARSFAGSTGSPGDNNRTTVRLVGVPLGPDGVEFYANSIPEDPATTNSVTVCRGLRPNC
jgi:hypothetical protein